MNNYFELPRDDRMEVRLPKALKQDANRYCQTHNTTLSTLMIATLTEKISGCSSSISNMDYQNRLNRIYNLTLAFTDLNPEYKRLLQKELITNEK